MSTINRIDFNTFDELDMDTLNKNLQAFLDSDIKPPVVSSSNSTSTLVADMIEERPRRPLEHYLLTDAIRPTFKTDEIGKLILRFDVLKTALLGNDTLELRKELSSHVNAMMTTARILLVSDRGLIEKNIKRLEAAGVHVSLCPSQDGEGYLLVLNAQGVGFSRRLYLNNYWPIR